MLCGFQIDSLTNSYIPENYKVCKQLDISALNKLLEWDSAKTTFESSSSIGESDTNMCTYYNGSESLEIFVVESSYLTMSNDGYTLKVTPGSFNENTGEITYEYNEMRNYFNISIKYKTTDSYDQMERLLSKISKLIEFKRMVMQESDSIYYND